MEFGTLEREIQIDATPEVVYEVITSSEHLKEWWPDDASGIEPVPGATGTLKFGDQSCPDGKLVPLTVCEADPPRRFVFRWANEAAPATETNSFLVIFELTPSEGGTLLRLTETGFRERGWEAAVLEETYLDHARGWEFFLPRLVKYAGVVQL